MIVAMGKARIDERIVQYLRTHGGEAPLKQLVIDLEDHDTPGRDLRARVRALVERSVLGVSDDFQMVVLGSAGWGGWP
jgi:hypothetical protein